MSGKYNQINFYSVNSDTLFGKKLAFCRILLLQVSCELTNFASTK